MMPVREYGVRAVDPARVTRSELASYVVLVRFS